MYPSFRPDQTQLIKCQFYVGWNPLWAWPWSVLDPQDSIKELRGIHLTPPV